MKRISSRARKIAIVLLVIWIYDIAMPFCAFALTSGPVQPETKGFQVAGVSDMVNLETGDFKYNIPLLDIDGYPINLNYQSGTGIDDEASWVGLGWNLTTGAINRQVRGLPDDLSGDNDKVVTEHTIKPKVTIGGKVTAKTELFGLSNVNGSFTFGVFNDNYTGMGAELGVNAGISFSLVNSGMLTGGMGIGVLSNTQSGVDVTPYLSLSIKDQVAKNTSVNAGLTSSFGYNSRSGIKGLTLSTSYGVTATKSNVHIEMSGYDITNVSVSNVDVSSGGGSGGGTSISYNTEPIQPSIQTEYRSTYDSFSFDVGAALFGSFTSIGGTGYRNVRDVRRPITEKPAYGFLYAERGSKDPNALMDFIREKDNPIIEGIPNLALPIHTPDLWSYTSQTGSGQFRLFRRGTGAFFDGMATDTSEVHTDGFDFGAGAIFHGGITNYEQETSNTTKKWTTNNAYLAKGDFATPDTKNIHDQTAYFKLVGEKNIEDKQVNDNLKGTDALAVELEADRIQPKSTNNFTGAAGPVTYSALTALNSRRPTSTTISYLTAGEKAANGGSGAYIQSYHLYTYNPSVNFVPPAKNLPQPEAIFQHDPDHQRSSHISEITVTDGSGKRMVYGIPVYNLKHDEYTFAVNSPVKTGGTYPADNLIDIPDNLRNTDRGVDNYFQRETKPAYATSYLLTSILSPDYVDRTGDGISDDDPGTAIKFNYSKVAGTYHWRTPYAGATPGHAGATLNKCLQADPDDDKASVVYGEKELWYTSSIETKTKVVYFITEDRLDGLGVDALDWTQSNYMNGSDHSSKQRCLREIRLYSKADMSKPIKIVRFDYDYSLCPNTENSSAVGRGKLTLTKVWFQYGNSDKGKYHPYTFTYNTHITQIPGVTGDIGYGHMMTDRWGTYKDPSENTPFNLNNEEFPYTDQHKNVVDECVALWHLSRIDLPTGGRINVTYESGDYAYVQNKRAMVMQPIKSVIAANASGSVTHSDGENQLLGGKDLSIRVDLGTIPASVPGSGSAFTSWFINKYLNGSKYLYTKLCVKVATGIGVQYSGALYDYVPCYSEIDDVVRGTGGIVNIHLTPLTVSGHDYNPISVATWQRIKNEYPRYAYPGYDNREATQNNSLTAAIGAIIDAAKNLGELKQNFYEKAQGRGYGSEVNLAKSFVRLVEQTGSKLGGPARVKKITISDNWANGADPGGASYGQSYDYRTADGMMSSGVASYEPSIGNDENPLKQPVPYIQQIKGAINNYFNLEEPFGESLYPAPSIVYSRVKVNDLDQSGNPSTKTGYSVNEFYTAKDFPVRVTVLPIISNRNKPDSHYSFLETNSIDEQCLSQGYRIELNDMHGKPKASHVYNSAGAEIASTVTYYKADDVGGGEMALNNKVTIINQDGTIGTDKIIGQDIDFFTDMREQESVNHGRTINIGVDVLPIPIPFLGFLPIPHFPINSNNDYKLFRSACAVKVVQSYGIVSKVVKTVNGSSNTSENLAYDGPTGDVLLTRTQNEFKQDIYSLKVPAYWAYPGMGPAYQTLGALLSGLKVDNTGQLSDDFGGNLVGGDELIAVSGGGHYWVVDIPPANVPVTALQPNSDYATHKYLVSSGGGVLKNTTLGLMKISRSGHRNLLGDGITNIVCLNNPIQSGHLRIADADDLTSLKVLNASASTFDENWATEIPEYHVIEDKSQNWEIMKAPDAIGSRIYDSSWALCGGPPCPNSGYLTGTYWFNKFPNTAILPTTIYGSPTGKRFNIIASFDVEHDGNYIVGYESSHLMSFGFNCVPSVTDEMGGVVTGNDKGDTYGWKGVNKYLTKGKNWVYIVGDYFPESANGVALEVYDNTAAEMGNFSTYIDGSPGGPKVIFSTRNLQGRTDLPMSYTDIISLGSITHFEYELYAMHFTYDDGYNTPFSPCGSINAVNPYTYGFKGNWRPSKTKVFQQSRAYTSSVKTPKPAVGVSNAGYINNFYSNWYWPGGASKTWIENTAPQAAKWVTANTVTLYDNYGQQLENKDALGRYSAAKFDFNGELPSAVASNAMNREIYVNGFEDTKIAAAQNPVIPVRDLVDSVSGSKTTLLVDNTVSHTGNYSVMIPPNSKGAILSTIVYKPITPTSNYLDINDNYEHVKKTAPPDHKTNYVGLYPNGFEPTGNKYILDVWVKDDHPYDKTINIGLEIKYHETVLPVTATCKAVVEDWKLIEVKFDLSNIGLDGLTSTQSWPLRIWFYPISSSNVYIDDVRIHPKDSHMKTYAYDDKTLRLMAELDENCFATFYEYDDEGLLVRVKKETEKGIMTLKESRSSYKKITP